MNKFTPLATALAISSLMCGSAFAQATINDNWTGGGSTVKNGTNELCWRNSAWTSASADKTCDGAPKPVAAPAPAPAPVPAPAPAPAPVPAPAPAPAPAPVEAPKPPAPTSQKISYGAEGFFDSAKFDLKTEGKKKLDELVTNLKGVNLEVIIVVGHTDSDGSDAANQALSLKRADAVKSYLVAAGVDKNRVYTEGKGEKQPIADNKTKEGKAKNRRVEIEVVGTRTVVTPAAK